MDLGDRNIVEMIAKIIEEGKTTERTYSGFMFI